MCKSEVDSMGRIAAGVLRLLKLEKSLGKETIDKLSNLGKSDLAKLFHSVKVSILLDLFYEVGDLRVYRFGFDVEVLLMKTFASGHKFCLGS